MLRFSIPFLVVRLLVIWLLCQATAFAASPIALWKSERNQAAYSYQNIGEFEDDWQSFLKSFETANVRYDQLGDTDVKAGSTRLSEYKVIVLPLFVDISDQGLAGIQDFIARGGKILVTDGGGNLSEKAQQLMGLTGTRYNGHKTTQEAEQFIWERQPLPIIRDFSIGTMVADITPLEAENLAAEFTSPAGAKFGTAISHKDGNTFIAWAPGPQGEITTNGQVISLALEDASPGITTAAAIQISFADYQTMKQELEYLARRTDEVMRTAKQADLAVPHKSISEHYAKALKHVQIFEEAYKERRFLKVDEELDAARTEFALAFCKAMPVRPVEYRSVWLDRGTIVATKNDEGMAALIEKLKNAGFNAIYFETNNSGYCMYPSRICAQNPQLNGWDAFGCALREAKKQQMEFHAWVWVFNVGNQRHNPIIGKEEDYPGPVLSANDYSWALAGKHGNLFAHNQHEFWINPANLAGRQFMQDLFAEIVSKYEVDGLQYDYIRYPFNGKPNQMGYDWSGRVRFERETGLRLDSLDEEGANVFQSWRIQQVNNFVRETSERLRKIRPNIRLSAAVYGFPKRLRCWNVQQEWETWVDKGWIDAVNPMTYCTTAKDLKIIANNCREYSEDKALVFPGVAVRQIDAAGLIEQLDTARQIGALGTTIFAVAQLDDKKLSLLRQGPYRRDTLLTPQSEPIKASKLLIDDFAATVNRYLHDPNKRVVADTASTNAIVQEIEIVQKQVSDLTQASNAGEIEQARQAVLKLQRNIREWLRIEAFIQRGFRAEYIASYLSQVDAILSYTANKARTSKQAVAAK